MSITLIAALALAATPAVPASTISAQDRPAVAAAARRMNVPARSLYRAMTARVLPRTPGGEIRYCVARSRVVSGKQGAVCRTRSQWAGFGLIVPNRPA